MNDEEIAERLARLESSTKSAHHRLDSVEKMVKSINQLSENVAVMATEMRYAKEEVQQNNREVKELKETVEILSTKDGKSYADIKRAFINAFLGAVATALAGGIIYLINL